jgi:hypothetical protein
MEWVAGIMRPGCEAHHPLLSSPKVNKAAVNILSPYAFIALKHNDKCTPLHFTLSSRLWLRKLCIDVAQLFADVLIRNPGK